MHHKDVAACKRVIVVIYTFEMCACRAERTGARYWQEAKTTDV